MQSMHCTERIFVHTCAQWAHICMVSLLCTMNVQLASPNVHRCRGLQLQGQPAHRRQCPDDYTYPPKRKFRTDVQESLQCWMCRGAMRFVLGIDTLHCSIHKNRRGLEKLPISLFRFACFPISPVQKNVHRLWWGFHINRALEHSGEEGGGEDEKEKVMPRKLASF